jgi:hypothetical protein
LVKNNRPFTDHEDLIQLQNKNGLDVGITLHSRCSVTEIIKHIASEFKKLISKLSVEDQKISVLIDGSKTLGKQSTLVVYIKTFLDEKEEIMFDDLIALENQRAQTITTHVLNCLYSYGLTQSYLKINLICFACDGASVMVGTTSDVGESTSELIATSGYYLALSQSSIGVGCS